MQETTDNAAQRWSSRKFWAVMFWCVVATGLLIAGYITDEIWQSVIMWLLGAYVGVNVAQKVWAK